MERKIQLPDFENFSLQSNQNEEVSLTEKELPLSDFMQKSSLLDLSFCSIIEMHKTALYMLQLDWVQEKLEKRWEGLELRNREAFWI